MAQFKFDLFISILSKFFEFSIKLFSLVLITSAISQLRVGSSLEVSIFFSQFISLILLVMGPLQPCRLSYDSIPFLSAFTASI